MFHFKNLLFAGVTVLCFAGCEQGMPESTQGDEDQKEEPDSKMGWTRVSKDNGRHYTRKKGQVFVRFKEGASPSSIRYIGQNVTELRRVTKQSYLLGFDEESADWEDIRDALMSSEGVESAEPNFRVKSLIIDTNDPIFKKDFTKFQKILKRTRNRPVARTAEPRSASPREIRVGIIDTGVDFDHPDLAPVVVGGVNFVYDDDGNPKRVNPAGARISQEESDYTEMDYHGHGTQMAGIIGAAHNGVGIDGVCENVAIYGLKAFDQSGYGTLADIVASIQWAMDNNMDLLNMAFGTYEHSEILEDVIERADAKGLVLVAAAGNDYSNQLMYPAKYEGVLSVGSHGDDGVVSRFSNWDSGIDIYALGEDIMTTSIVEQGYSMLSGTSAACAYATGMVAMGLAEGLSKSAILETIRQTDVEMQSQRNPSNRAFSNLNEEAYIGTLFNTPVERLAVTKMQSPRKLWFNYESVEIEYAIQNTGLVRTDPIQLTVDYIENGVVKDYGDISVPSLMPGEVYSDAYVSRLGLLEGNGVIAKINIENEFQVPIDNVFRDGILLEVSNEEVPLIKVYGMWITHPDFRDEAGRSMMINFANRGNAPLSNLAVKPRSRLATQEGMKVAEENVLALDYLVSGLAPGEQRTISIPLDEFPVPDMGSFTVYTDFVADGEKVLRKDKVYDRVPGGQATILQKQKTHRYIVKQAVDLLRKQGIFIPDLHVAGQPYLGPYGHYDDHAMSMDRRTYITCKNDPYCTLVNGSHDEDELDVIFGYSGLDTWDSHFWVVDDNTTSDNGLDSGSANHHSALTKIRAIMFGKYYGFPTADSLITNGAIDHYKAGYKSAAWWLVGRAAHLIADVATPEHVNNENYHGAWGPIYEDWMKLTPLHEWGNADSALRYGGYIDPYQAIDNDPVRFLAYTTAQVGNSFPWASRSFRIGKGGNRNAHGIGEHYDHYMNDLYAIINEQSRKRPGIPNEHPKGKKHLIYEEVYDTCWKECQEELWDEMEEWFDQRRDCWDGGDDRNHKDHSNYRFSYGDLDNDLSAIAVPALNYSIRATAGLIYYFAKETGQFLEIDWRDRTHNKSAMDIGVGANGSVFIIGPENYPQHGSLIYQLTGNAWSPLSGQAVRIDVDPNGKPWVVNREGDVWQWTGITWKRRATGKATDIGIGSDGSVFIIGNENKYHGSKIYKFAGGTSWDEYPGRAVRISVNHKGKPWVINKQGVIFRWKKWKSGEGDSWGDPLPGPKNAHDIGVGTDGTVIITAGEYQHGQGYETYVRRQGTGDTFEKVDGYAMEVDAATISNLWKAKQDKTIHQGS